MQIKRLVLAAFGLTVALAGCTEQTPTAAPPTSSAVSQASATPAAGKPTPACAELANASVRGLIDPYYAFGDQGAQLADGMFSDKDGLVLALQKPCATGDFGPDIGAATVGVIMNSVTGTTGRFSNVMLCTKESGKARCMVHIAMNDRDPIESVSFSGNKMTLVYLTRPDEQSSAVVTIKRTAIYAAEGTVLKEQSHTDAPYMP